MLAVLMFGGVAAVALGTRAALRSPTPPPADRTIAAQAPSPDFGASTSAPATSPAPDAATAAATPASAAPSASPNIVASPIAPRPVAAAVARPRPRVVINFDGGPTSLDAARALSAALPDSGSDATNDATATAAADAAAEAPAAAAVPEAAAGVQTARGGPARAPLDWRTIISHPGVAFSAQDITDASSGTSSMASAHALRTYTVVQLSLDLDSLIGIPGLSTFVQYKNKTGRNGSGEASFVQNYSNIDAGNFRALGEVWLQQNLWSDRLRVKAGRLDFNSEFGAPDNAGQFLNASMGYTPAIAAAPTFPLPTSGLNMFVTVNDGLTIGAGVFNGLGGAPAAAGHSSRFGIAQANQTWTAGASELAGRLGVGAWHHSGMFASLNADASGDPDVRGNHGWYATLDQTLWQGAVRDPSHADQRAQIAAFLQVGHADPSRQTVHAHHGGGVTITGFSSHRPEDVLGFGITNAAWSAGHESISELFYQLPVTSHLSLVADMQRVNRRDDQLGRRAGMISTLRTIVTF